MNVCQAKKREMFFFILKCLKIVKLISHHKTDGRKEGKIKKKITREKRKKKERKEKKRKKYDRACVLLIKV